MFTGLAHEKIKWDQNIKHFDWEEFDKVSAGVFNPAKSALLSSYGLLARDYMHALIRFGYHFVVVDSLLVGKTGTKLHPVQLQGGWGRMRPSGRCALRAIRTVLEKYGFDIDCPWRPARSAI
jgi:pyruvate, water dikinase